MIYVDTDQLITMMGMLSTANDKINEAMEMLLQTTIHDDWGCKERDTINAYVLESREKCRTLKERCDNYTNAAKQASDGFLERESEISEMLSGVDDLIGHLLAEGIPEGTIGRAAANISVADLKNMEL